MATLEDLESFDSSESSQESERENLEGQTESEGGAEQLAYLHDELVKARESENEPMVIALEDSISQLEGKTNEENQEAIPGENVEEEPASSSFEQQQKLNAELDELFGPSSEATGAPVQERVHESNERPVSPEEQVALTDIEEYAGDFIKERGGVRKPKSYEDYRNLITDREIANRAGRSKFTKITMGVGAASAVGGIAVAAMSGAGTAGAAFGVGGLLLGGGALAIGVAGLGWLAKKGWDTWKERKAKKNLEKAFGI